MKAVKDILPAFKTISLTGMDKVSLMDRTDTKFTVSLSVLPLVLEKLQPHYKLLQVNNTGISSYKTLYFDTPELDLYLKHHNGHLNRHKVRYRQYVESNSAFLEVKFKNNKGKTFKQRIAQNTAPETWDETAIDFVKEKTPYDSSQLKPLLWVNYQRITLVDNEHKERVTIDLGLEFLSGSLSRRMNNLCILEIKRSSMAKSPALTILKEFKIREVSLSKYCLAMTQLYPHVKKNNFKETLTALNKLIYDTSFNVAAGI